MSGSRRAFSWDEAKSEANRARRGFGFTFATRLVDSPIHVMTDNRFDCGETRLRAIGRIDGQPFAVVFVERGSVTHIISARRAHQKEWDKWPK